MVPQFERRKNLHPLNLVIDVDPTKAKAELLRAYKRGSFSLKGAARALEVSHTTFIRWVKKLDLWDELDDLRSKAEENGIVLHSRRPARKVG
jgi:hypothetical protein